MKYSTFANRLRLIVRRNPVGERKLKFVVSPAIDVFIKKKGLQTETLPKGYELIRLALSTYIDVTNADAAEVLVRISRTDTSRCGNKRIGL